MDLCEPHHERGLIVRAEKIVAGTPMCDACFAGRPVSNLVDELFEMLLEMPRLPRKSYGIRTLSSVERIRRRGQRIRTIRPRTSWRRGKRELKLPVPPRLAISPRQSEVLSLLAKGLSNKEIATALGTSERAIKFHLSNLYKKSATKNRTNLLLWHLRRIGAIASAGPENSLVQASPGGIEVRRQETSA
jgi:DNA-binding CsgD family transcriptional regulator